MDIYTAVCFALITAVLALTLKNRPDISVILSIAGGVALLISFLPHVAAVIDAVNQMAQRSGIDGGYMLIVMKASGIATAVTICSAVCRDAGQSALAVKVEIAGRIAILTVSLPVINTLFDTIAAAMR